MTITYNRIAGQSLERLAALSDGIFAVAMTLLVLDIHEPSMEAVHSEQDLWNALSALLPRVVMYLMSFLTLGIFWTGQGFRCPRCGCGKAWAVRITLFQCSGCNCQTSVTAGTVFQDTRKPLCVWFRAMLFVTSQKDGASALGLQRILGLGSYRTAWSWLHKLRRAMVRSSRDRLVGWVEVDETYWGAPEEGVEGRGVRDKALIVIAAQADGKGIGRIRMRVIPHTSAASLHPFIEDCIEPGSTVHTDGWPGYAGLKKKGYVTR